MALLSASFNHSASLKLTALLTGLDPDGYRASQQQNDELIIKAVKENLNYSPGPKSLTSNTIESIYQRNYAAEQYNMSVTITQPAGSSGQGSVTVPGMQQASTTRRVSGEETFMTYRDNKVDMPFSPGDGYNLVSARFTIEALSITDEQDPDGKNQVGQVRQWSGPKGSATWSVGRKKSAQVADFWMDKINANQSTFGHDPEELNFAFFGTLNMLVGGGLLGANEDLYTFPGVAIGQGSGDTNNWWFGGQTGLSMSNNTVRLQGASSSGFSVNFYFRRGGSGNPGDEIKLTKIEFANYTMFSLGSSYVGENLGDVWQSGAGGEGKLPPFITYYNAAQSDTLRLRVKDGLLYTSTGRLFDTAGADLSHSKVPVAIFVVDAKGNVYASNQFKVFMFHHSSILAGANVASAGELQATQGKITFMSNLSGHYRPTPDVARLQLTEALYRQGYHEAIPLTVGDFSQLLY